MSVAKTSCGHSAKGAVHLQSKVGQKCKWGHSAKVGRKRKEPAPKTQRKRGGVKSQRNSRRVGSKRKEMPSENRVRLSDGLLLP